MVDAESGSSAHDEFLHFYRGNDENIPVLTRCVDHILITGDDEAEVLRMVEYLLVMYEERDLGVPDKSLGINYR